MKSKIIEETPISAADVKAELKKIRERDDELNFRAQKTEDYLNQLIGDPKKLASLAKKLVGLKIPRLKEEHIVKLTDVLPTTDKDVKVVLQGYAVTISKDGMKKIADAIKEFVE
jgi:DNA-directed RNA polymerase subunit F